MSDAGKAPPKGPTPFERFKEFTRRLVAVPKDEIAKREIAYRRHRDRSKAKGPRG